MNILKFFLKLLLGCSLIFWLIKNGNFNSAPLLKTLHSPMVLVLVTFLLILQVFLVSWRWNQILSFRMNIKLSIKDFLAISWIGMFFSTVLRGVITGDVIKINYVKKLDKAE